LQALQALDLRGEFAPLHGESEQGAANVPIGGFLRHSVALERVGPAIFFGHRSVLPKALIARPPDSRFALNQIGSEKPKRPGTKHLCTVEYSSSITLRIFFRIRKAARKPVRDGKVASREAQVSTMAIHIERIRCPRNKSHFELRSRRK